MATCNVNDCADRAVGFVAGADGYQNAYRCRDCLVFDLDLGGTD